MESACQACDAPLPPKSKRWCSEACRVWGFRNPGQKRLRRGQSTACPTCGQTFPWGGKRRYCSKLCAEIACGSRRYGPPGWVIVCDVCERRAAVCHPMAKTCHRCAPERKRRRQRARRRTNPEGVRAAERRNDQKRYARRQAERRAKRWAKAAREVERTWLALPPAPEPPTPRTWPSCSLKDAPRARVFYGAACAECGVAITVTRLSDPYHSRQFCSRACSKRYWRRGFRRRGGIRDPHLRAAIFARDEYRCQLCGGMTDPEAVVPARRAPVVDHIVATANGGQNVPENLQTAHFYCNSLKRNLADEVFVDSFVLWR
jgi:endogenous inhibitor of DNA gyrase (YacG/DUF329 family)